MDVDEADFPAFWALLPQAAEVLDVAAWSADAATVFARDRQLDDPEVLDLVRGLLADLVVEDTAFDDSLRFLFMPDPDFGGVLWEVAFASPDGDRDWAETSRDLVGADLPTDLGVDVSGFEFNGIPGLHCARFQTVVDPQTQSRSIAASVSVTVRRALPGLGVCDVIAFAGTAQLEPLAMSLDPMHRLLCSDYFAGLIRES